MRALTRTTLAVGDLLEIPVGIAAATGSREVKLDNAAPDGAKRVQFFAHPDDIFDAIDAESGELIEVLRSERELLDATTREPLDPPAYAPLTEVVKGVRVGDDLRQIPPSEIEYAKAATTLASIELLEFIDYRRVPTDRLEGSFWVQPDEGFARPLRTLMEAMRAEHKAMVVKFCIRERQRLGVIRVRRTEHGHAESDALLLNVVAFAETWREPDAAVLAPAAVEEVNERGVEHARSLIRDLTGDGKALEGARDELTPILSEVVERAADGVYADATRTLELAARYRAEDLHARAEHLVEWAEHRWPELADKREQVERVIAEGGEPGEVGEKLAAIVG